MIIDTSAMAAIFLGEAEAQGFARAIETADIRMMSAASVLELGMVLIDRKGSGIAALIDQALKGAGIEIIAFDEEQARLARDAFIRFGKGRHRAALNFGGCMTYALAKCYGLPVLCKGTDFRATDIEVVAV